MKITKEGYLYKEGDVADKVFIVKEGEFEVTKKLVSNSKQTENI
jgi:CRP-like cAMP-binding protein